MRLAGLIDMLDASLDENLTVSGEAKLKRIWVDRDLTYLLADEKLKILRGRKGVHAASMGHASTRRNFSHSLGRNLSHQRFGL
jgi:hypothetical protein